MPILECLKVSKAYGGLLAVSDLSFAVEPGEVYAIVGPNGAGKTSLFDCISGVNPATSGIIKFKDREIQGLRAHQISRLGLARTFQTTVAFNSQTVLTNVLVGGAFGRDGANPTLWFNNQAQEDALDALALCGLGNQQRKLAGALPVLARKRLMLATALAMRPQMLLLDEPFGGLNPVERAQMIDLIRVVAKTGLTILMIDHVMKAGQALADRILVIDLGPNGHGKTTLLRAITGLLPPRAGQVLLDGKDITHWKAEAIAAAGVIHIPQGDLLFAEMTVTENLLMGAYHGPTWSERNARLGRVYELFPWLKERGGQLARTLSGGERRMLALGRGLMSKARLLLIDEPSLGLAPIITQQIYASIHKVKQGGMSLLIGDENANYVAGLAYRV